MLYRAKSFPLHLRASPVPSDNPRSRWRVLRGTVLAEKPVMPKKKVDLPPEPPSAPPWPDHFPECCPPDDADALDGRLFFRFLLRFDSSVGDFFNEPHLFPVGPEDMVSYKEAGRGDGCQSASLSCFVSKEKLLKLLPLPKFRGEPGVMVGSFGPGDGRFSKPSKRRGHCEVWLNKNALSRAHILFTVAL